MTRTIAALVALTVISTLVVLATVWSATLHNL